VKEMSQNSFSYSSHEYNNTNIYLLFPSKKFSKNFINLLLEFSDCSLISHSCVLEEYQILNNHLEKSDVHFDQMIYKTYLK
jgi:hypothetical protein